MGTNFPTWTYGLQQMHQAMTAVFMYLKQYSSVCGDPTDARKFKISFWLLIAPQLQEIGKVCVPGKWQVCGKI